jgi:6-phosphofructokinase 1
VLEERLGEDVRVTVLGHVQRGGSPSAFDRNLSTLCGARAVDVLLAEEPVTQPLVIGIRGNKITETPLVECLQKTHEVGEAITANDYERAMAIRGSGFAESFRTVRTMVRAMPHDVKPGQRRLRIAVLNAGGPAPGMNTAVRTAVRLGVDKGHVMLGVYNSFAGLAKGDIKELDWMSVGGWATRGGSELGTNRKLLTGSDFYALARHIEEHQIEGLLVIGGLSGYENALAIHEKRDTFPAFNIPIICVPASINNNLPGAELSIGADTALNNIVEAVDKIKQSAVASRRAFVVEVMGRYCGYLALMSALATGAERVYLHEEGVTLEDLVHDVKKLKEAFSKGKRLGLILRNENANTIYSTNFMHALFEEEGGDLFDVRQAILGHLQQGGDPSPFDRIMATRLATKAIDFLEGEIGKSTPRSVCIGQVQGKLELTDIRDLPRLMDMKYGRPLNQWWMNLRPVAKILAQPAPENPLTRA